MCRACDKAGSHRLGYYLLVQDVLPSSLVLLVSFDKTKTCALPRKELMRSITRGVEYESCGPAKLSQGIANSTHMTSCTAAGDLVKPATYVD
jgi:hypothetical protein